MAVTTAQSRLILRSIMACLRNNLVASDIIDWETHSTEMNDRNGFVVSEQRGPEYVITESTGAVQDLSSGVQSTVFGAQTFKLNKVFGLSMGASDIEHITDLGSARRSRALNNGLERMASRIDKHIMQVAAEAFPYSVGTWGTGLDDPDEIASARTRLAEASLESDNDINTVITHADRQGLAKFIYNDNAALASEGQRAMRTGFSGMINGIPVKSSNQLGRITTGDRDGAGAIAGASQDVNYADVADAGSNAGQYLTQTLNVDSMGSSITVKAGEVFTIANVKAWDPEINAVRPFDAQFTVVADATSDSAGTIALTIFPAIVVQGGIDVNTAHATVDSAPSNGAVVTFLGSASTEYIPRLMFKKEAIVAHSAPLMLPYTGQGFRRSFGSADSGMRNGTVPLMPRLWLYSDPDTGEHKSRVDVFMQAQARDRWLGVKYFGTTV